MLSPIASRPASGRARLIRELFRDFFLELLLELFRSLFRDMYHLLLDFCTSAASLAARAKRQHDAEITFSSCSLKRSLFRGRGLRVCPVRWVASAQSRSGDTRVPFRPLVDERAQRSQPGFVASPAPDGVAIDRLPGLPLAGGLHSPRIAFGAQARVAL